MKYHLSLAAALVFLLSCPASAKVGFRQVTCTYPVAVQKGSTSEVQLYSNFTLDGAHSVFFDRPGMSMSFLETKPIKAPRRGRSGAGTPFRFRIEVPLDQRVGIYEYRVATSKAVSSASHILVTDFPVVLEAKAENGLIESAQQVPFPAAVCGICNRAEDVDYYRFPGKAGQKVTLQIYAQRVTASIHSMVVSGKAYHMDSILTLIGPNGQVVAQNDNYYGGDSFIQCTLPSEGDYVLQVRDVRYVGSQKYTYCVEMSDSPFVHGTLPMAVQKGSSVEARLVGTLAERATLTATKDEEAGWREQRFSTSAGPTNPTSILISEHPQKVAAEGNLTRETAEALIVPMGVTGQFASPNQTHYYSFDANKDSFYRIEIESHRRQLPLDAVLTIYDAMGKKITEADDGKLTKDSRIMFKAPASGKFFLSVKDLHDRGGERFLYHLTVEPAGPDFILKGEYYYAMLGPGTRMMWFAQVERLNGFDGPVEIQVEGLPPGVTATPVTIPKGLKDCAIVLSAAADAKIGASLAQVIGKATITEPDQSTREIVRSGRVTCELQGGGGGQVRWPIHTQLVAVTEPLDLLGVEASPAEITLKPGEQTEISFRVTRNKDFKDPVTIAMAFKYFAQTYGSQLPPGVTMEKGSTERIVGDKLEGKIILKADPKKSVPVEKFPIAVLARVAITFSITTNYASNPVLLTVLPAEEPAKK